MLADSPHSSPVRQFQGWVVFGSRVRELSILSTKYPLECFQVLGAKVIEMKWGAMARLNCLLGIVHMKWDDGLAIGEGSQFDLRLAYIGWVM
jgi:hypothetical protein